MTRDEAFMLLGYVANESRMGDICPDCREREEEEYKVCRKCGVEYNDKGDIKRKETPVQDREAVIALLKEALCANARPRTAMQ